VLSGTGTENKVHASVSTTSKNDAAILSTDTLVANTWTHVAVTYSATQGIKLYHNGVLVSSDDGVGGTISYNSSKIPAYRFCVGGIGSIGNHYWKGMLDEVRLYNYALKADKIAELAK
jgi:hypothetical protein